MNYVDEYLFYVLTLQKKLVESPKKFDPERVKRELLRINKDYNIVKADLVG